MSKQIKSLLLAFQFFTRIPIPMLIDFEGDTLKRGTLYLPFIGAVLGGLLYLFGLSVIYIFPPMIAASLTLCFCVYLTGGLHLDGLLDTADGVYSQRTGSEMLRIITDSRIGAFGAIVGILMLLLKFSLFYALFDKNLFSGLIILPMIWSRFVLIITIITQPYYSEEDGIGGLYAGMTQIHIYITFALALSLSGLVWLISPVTFFNYASLICAMLASNLLVMYLVARQLKKQLGGLTGDNYGAINELCEIASLLVLVAILNLI